MAGRSDIKAGRAFVELFLKNNIKRGLNEASKQLKSFGMGAMRLGSQIAGIGAAMTAAFVAPIKAAGDLMETTSKFGAVFGSEAEEATKWMEAFGDSVGRGRKELMDGMSSFQAFFSGMGLGAKEAAAFSKELTALSVDFASFHNMSDPEAMQRFISALSGSGEVLSMYGVNIMEAALNQKLLAMGFPTISKGATETQKVLARMSIIKESMGRQGAIGDAVKTAGSFSNQMKKLRGELANTSAEIGNALLPVVTPLVSWVAEAVKNTANWAKENQGFIRAAFQMSAGIAAAGAAIFAFGAAAVGISSILGGLATAAGFLFSPMGLFVAGVAAAATAWAMWSKSGQDAVQSIKALFGELAKTARDTFSGIADAIGSGNLELAVKIGMAGAKVAFLQFANFVEDNVSKTLGGIFGKLIGGDFKGAWSDALKAVGELWRQWSDGVVSTFTAAMQAVVDMWKSTTSSLANWLARDVAQWEQGRANSMNKDLLAGAAKRIERGEAAMGRLRSGETLSDAEAKEFGGGTVEALEAFLEDQRKQIASITGDKNGVMAIGRGAIDGVLSGQAKPIEDFFKTMNDVNANPNAGRPGATGPSAVDNALAAAASELKDLNAQAAELRKQREAEKAAAGAAVGAAGEAEVMKAAMKTSAGSGVFSAAAALRMGSGAKPEDKIVAEAKRGNKALVAKLDRNIQAVEKIQLQVVG